MSKERPFVPDNSPKHGSEELRKAVEDINKEGWEENAAIIIGKDRADLNRRREKLEKEGQTADLRTYIHMNSETVATAAELGGGQILDRDTRERWEKLEKGVYRMTYVGNYYDFVFKSADGSLKKVRVECEKIAELAGPTEVKQRYDPHFKYKRIKLLLEKNGFKIEDGASSTLEIVERGVNNYRMERAKAEKKDGFDF
jgi:hypothetical protein